jgi:acyl-CoA thioesterase I
MATTQISNAQSVQASVKTSPPALLIFGDSLSAEYGLKRSTGWVSLLQDRLKSEGFPHRIINASISGETTAGGLSRLAGLVKKHQPAAVVIQLGANDGLRGLPVSQTERNLKRMLEISTANGAKAVIVGIRVPPNYGAQYTTQFDNLFTKLGQQTNTPVVPFFFEGFAEKTDFFQADGIHPNEKAQPMMLNIVWPALKPVLAASMPAVAR